SPLSPLSSTLPRPPHPPPFPYTTLFRSRYIREVAALPWSSGIFTEDDRQVEFQRLLKLVPALFEIRAIDEHGKERLHVSHSELRSEEHTSELQSRFDLVCRLLLEKKKK